MLRKLLKYDLLSVWKSGWGTLPVMAGCAVAASAAARVINSEYARLSVDSVNTVSIIVLLISLFGIIGCGVVIGDLVFVRFSNNFFTDEGYLTFTLPVKRNTLLLSKTLNAGICLIAYVILVIACVLVFFTFGNFDFNIYEEIWEFLKGEYLREGAMLFVYCFEGALVLLSMLFLGISTLHYAITVGSSISKKERAIASIGVFFAVSVVTSLIIPDPYGYFWTMNENHAVMLLIYAISIFTPGLVLYFLTLDRISRKLNLD